MSTWLAASRAVPGGVLWHPVAIAAIVLLLVNDHWLKHLAPGPLTGKLSDFAGLVFFPLLLVAAAELAAATLGRSRPQRSLATLIAALATGIVYSAVKLMPEATAAYNDALGVGQWLLAGDLSTVPVATAGVTDPSDLVALPSLAIAYLVARDSGPVSVSTRLQPMTVGLLMLAGLAALATSPAMRSSSTTYEEELRFTRSAPAVTRHLTLDVTNRDSKLSNVTLLAETYSERGSTRFETPGLILSLVADPDDRDLITTAYDYIGPAMSLFEACESNCRIGTTVVVRLADPESIGADAEVTTNLEVILSAGAAEEGTGPVDIDLAIVNDAEQAFEGAPATLIDRETGSFHVGSDVSHFTDHYRITIDGAVLTEPYGFPLIGQIEVGASGQQSSGHPNAHQTAFEFRSAATNEYDSYPYDYASILYDAPPWNEPTVLDLLPLCEPNQDCTIDAILTSYYDETINDPPKAGTTPPPRSIDLDWYLEVRLEAYDGRPLPDGAVTIEAVD